MSLYDFYMYLKYIEHSSENLEFYMWYDIWPRVEGSVLTLARFKNYEDAYARGLAVVGEKNLRSTGSVESVSSQATLKKRDSTEGAEDDEEDPEVGMYHDALRSCVREANCHPAKETLARIAHLISNDALCSSKSSCSPRSEERRVGKECPV